MKQVNWLKVFGFAILMHVILIGLSILTVFIYSLVINPGQPEAFYEAFAVKSGPYVSAIGGFILVYLFVIWLNRGKTVSPFIIGLGLPTVYIIIDYLLVAFTMPNWTEGLPVMLVSDAIKLLAGIIAAYRSKAVMQP